MKKFKLISSDENDPKFNISPTLGLKLQNHLQEIPPIEGLSKLPRACPNFSKEISFDFVSFSLTKLFNIQKLLHCKSKHSKTLSMHPSHGRLSNCTKRIVGATVVWEISM
jgi:hypothetical protein